MKSMIVAVAIALSSQPCITTAQPSPHAIADEQRQSVQRFTSRFLKSFEDLDLDAFMDCFAPDASVFFPIPEPPDRFDGKEAIREHFALVFSSIRKSSDAKKPPYHHLPPERLAIVMLSENAALVTFELENKERIARRTLVVVRSPNGWLIKHLHASNTQVQR
ncbi:nuclear transport factor 2 family protein [Massilia sp. TW-1]|uniref:Nuclear transport factor 2 family protein n=1 Tax=Telluria antibiotica TaxID=2717319 RepID=A0ABX0PCS2_9BURK|nr:nuclear transport factor 2 family protein [Telluria antibiotica]NIA54810.1 nuclear transport factor 2 family protein [Telluria antibiotica]